MTKCGCRISSDITEEVDLSDFEEKELAGPTILNYKKALRNLGSVIKLAAKSSDGKKLPDEYWKEVSNLLKKAKLGISMLELGIDDDEPLANDKKDAPAGGDAPTDGDAPAGGDDETTKKLAAIGLKKESLTEKAKSAAQQRLFGMVHAYKKGELEKSEVDSSLWDKIKQIAKGISGKDAEDIAKTKHGDLPETVPANESERTNNMLDDIRHLGTILESDDFKIVSVNHFDIGLVAEVRKDDKTHILTLGNIVTLEGEGYSFDLGTTSNFGTVADKFKKLAAREECELLQEYQKESNA